MDREIRWERNEREEREEEEEGERGKVEFLIVHISKHLRHTTRARSKHSTF